MIDWCPDTGPERPQAEGARGRTERRLLALALLGEVEARRATTAERSRAAADVTRALARRMGWSARSRALLYEAALMQDVGYAALPGVPLAPDAPLDPEERTLLARHPAYSAELLSGVLRPEQLGWVRHHHERWDGAGYPAGLRGNDVPEGASLILLGAAWTAMTSDAAGRPGLSAAEALRECRVQAGRQFRPSAVAALMGLTRPRRASGGGAADGAVRIAC